MQRGALADARIQYEAVLNLSPNHATAHHMMGRINDQAKNFQRAESHYLQALSANPEDANLLSDLGYSYLQQGRLGEAREHLMKAITLDPDLKIAKVNMGAVYAYSGDQAGALAWLRQAGTEQQAQETLASLTTTPPPYVINQANGVLAKRQDEFTISNGVVRGPDGRPLETFDQLKEAMETIREQEREHRARKKQAELYAEDIRIKRAIGDLSRSEIAQASGQNRDAQINGQFRQLDNQYGGSRTASGNTQPIYIGPPGQNSSAPPAGTSSNQYGPGTVQGGAAWNNGAAGSINPQSGQFPNQQIPGQQNHYPGFGQQPAGQFPQNNPAYNGMSGNLQQNSSAIAGSSVPAPFPGQSIPGPTNNSQGIVGNQNNWSHPQSQFGDAAQTPAQGQIPAPQNYLDPALSAGSINGYLGSNSGTPSATLAPQPGQQQLYTSRPGVDQFGQPQRTSPGFNQPAIGSTLMHDTASNYGSTQPGYNQNGAGSTAPNPGYFGQTPPGAGPFAQPGQHPQSNAAWNTANSQQPIQQLQYQGPSRFAQIDRGQPMQQIPDSARQAMQLGMSAASGTPFPVDNAGGVPGLTNTRSGASANSGTWQHPQTPQQPAGQHPHQGYPGAAPQNNATPGNSQQPGNVPNVWAPGTQTHGSLEPGQPNPHIAHADPRSAPTWNTMRTTAADHGSTATWNYDTDSTQSQSGVWSQPNPMNGAWQTGALASPTTNPNFAPGRFTEPNLRPAGASTLQGQNGETVQTAFWGDRPQNGVPSGN